MDNNQACRICLDNIAGGISVFGEDGKRQYLQDKIRKYLYITISTDDTLPKIICSDCCDKLENIHNFATMASINQDKFLTKNPSNSPQREEKGLLHTYLTKGIHDKESTPSEDIPKIAITEFTSKYFMNIFSEEKTILSVKDDTDADLDPRMIVKCYLQDEDADSECPFSSEDEETYSHKCDTCSKSFPSDFLLMIHSWEHKRNEDDTETPASDFSCPICDKKVSTKGNLKVHLETHRPKGKYTCDKCGRIFKTLCNLHRHKEYHGTPQFPCSVCGRVYPTNSTLRAHSITHSDVRPHKCPLCTKTFKRNQDLKFHINQHTGARPYQCPYCPKAFASSGNCFSHRKRMHPVEVERDRERAATLM